MNYPGRSIIFTFQTHVFKPSTRERSVKYGGNAHITCHNTSVMECVKNLHPEINKYSIIPICNNTGPFKLTIRNIYFTIILYSIRAVKKTCSQALLIH